MQHPEEKNFSSLFSPYYISFPRGCHEYFCGALVSGQIPVPPLAFVGTDVLIGPPVLSFVGEGLALPVALDLLPSLCHQIGTICNWLVVESPSFSPYNETIQRKEGAAP